MTTFSSIKNGDPSCLRDLREVDFVSHLDIEHILTNSLDDRLCSSYKWTKEFHRKCGYIPFMYPMPAEIFHVTDRCENVTRWPIENIYQNIICTRKIKHDAVTKKTLTKNVNIMILAVNRNTVHSGCMHFGALWKVSSNTFYNQFLKLGRKLTPQSWHGKSHWC